MSSKYEIFILYMLEIRGNYKCDTQDMLKVIRLWLFSTILTEFHQQNVSTPAPNALVVVVGH